MVTINSTRRSLLQARKKYSACARVVERKIAHGLSPQLSEQIIGIGVVADWLRRAAEMDDIQYIGTSLNDSSRKTAFVELLRYNFAWFGLNAVFSRPTLLGLVGTASGPGEFADFRVLFDATPLAKHAAQLSTLHNLLSAPTAPRLAGHAPAASVTTLFAIDAKYIPSAAKVKGASKKVAAAAASGTPSALDLPTILYAFRNWSVHGNALDGAFGSRPAFLGYVGVLLEVLAEVHEHTASVLLTKL